jgi:hypothetical protein
VEVLNHITKRVKSQTNVKLPLADLVQQYVAPDASPIVQNLNIIYLGTLLSLSLSGSLAAVS